MKNVKIYTDEELAEVNGSTEFGNELGAEYPNVIFVTFEDGQTIIENESEDSLFVQEYK